MKALAKEAGMHVLAWVALAVVVLVGGIFTFYVLPLLGTWYGFLGACILILAFVTWLDDFTL